MVDGPPTEPPLRIAVFGESVVSDWENPAATSWRALLRALTAAGHEAVFFEQRRNRATVELLRARGSNPLRAFGLHYPDVRYRTYDLPRGLERSVWFGREVATLDAVIVLDTAPPEIGEELRGYTTPRLVRVWQHTGQSGAADVVDQGRFDLVLASEGGLEGDDVPFGPVVDVPTLQAAPPRSRLLVVAYGDGTGAGEIANALASLGPSLLTPGDLLAPWEFISEVDLPAAYRSTEVAVVIPADRSPLAAARAALPLAAGCPVLIAGRNRPFLPPDLAVPVVSATTVAREMTRLRESALPPPTVPQILRADLLAGRLVNLLRANQHTRLR